VGGYDEASLMARTLQGLSLLETFHAAQKLVHSEVYLNIMQWSARAHALFLVVQPEASLRSSPWSTIMLLAWGIGEACRYPKCVLTRFYALDSCKCLNALADILVTVLVPQVCSC
jgi:hypothetical protein